MDSDVTALVGPNEAGKTTILQALARLNSNDEFPASEYSRGTTPDPEHFLIEAAFQLDDSDHAALAEIPEARHVRTVTFAKRGDGSLRLVWHQPPTRDRGPRQAVVTLLQRAARSPALRDVRLADGTPVAERLTDLGAALSSNDETLPDDALDDLNTASAEIQAVIPNGAAAYVQGLPEALSTLSQVEREPHPRRRAADVLFERRPEFVWFDDAARTLGSSYSISSFEGGIPRSLANLAQLADLDLSLLATVVGDERRGEIQELLERANGRLDERFSEAWTQGKLAVRFDVEGETLQLFVREETGTFWDLAERSDGLRWFVALIALLAGRQYDTPPILLVDEAERHLHYDAQADLIRTFYSQSQVAGIVYTTHSAGCLPQDLGAGVKVVKRTDAHRSVIRNGFWVDDSGTPDEAGFSPVLMEMGASTLAFSAARFALICEGRTDLILLPTLLRQACDWLLMPFQVVPGLASISPYAVPNLDLAAARVLFLVDRDEGGRRIERKLRAAGVPPDRISKLGPHSAAAVTLEDFIDVGQHKAAIDARWQHRGEAQRVPASVLRSLGRSRRLAAWCKAQRPPVRELDKAQIAHALVSRAREGSQVVDGRRINHLRALAEELLARFEADG